jgi:hydrogenase expression/formation protein HypD
MKYVDEYRDSSLVAEYAKAIRAAAKHPWTIMEVCGGHTHAILRFGIDQLLPEPISLTHGPGCPVCVTPLEFIDKAIELAGREDVTFCCFGDMLRVPGSHGDLLRAKATGGDVRIVYSPLDALKLAKEHPDREVVFFAVGFETTASVNAVAVLQAAHQEIRNFSMLVAQVLVPPAMEAILSSPENRVRGFLAAAEKYGAPIVVTGFEPLDILQGIYMTVKQLEDGRAEVENQYIRTVRPEGNETARKLMSEVFRVVPRKWRGLGELPASGLALREEYRAYDAEQRFGVAPIAEQESPECISGMILQGLKKPPDCAAFGTRCTPERPLGAPMVSSEGACAAYGRYRRNAMAQASRQKR